MTTTERRARRVEIVHRQTRPTLLIAAAFCGAAAVATVLPHRTGGWLPLHLFLVGGLLAAISGATQLLAVTWGTAIPPSDAWVRAQRWLLTAGVLGLALGREAELPPPFLGLAGGAVIAALALLAALLLRIRATSKLDRFHPAVDAYLVGVGFGLLGCALGVAMATAPTGATGATRAAHLTANLFGLVGIVVGGTLPYLMATQLRSKMAPRATPTALRGVTALLATATLAAVAGLWFELPAVAAGGDALYALGIATTMALCPRVHRRQLQWAGPRLVLVLAGVLWWVAVTTALAVQAARGDMPSASLLVTLVVGGYAQILAGSIAYLAPVLRGGGHETLAAGFRVTRSYLALAAANVAAIGLVTGIAPLAAAALALWIVDTGVRGVLLLTARTREQT